MVAALLVSKIVSRDTFYVKMNTGIKFHGLQLNSNNPLVLNEGDPFELTFYYNSIEMPNSKKVKEGGYS